MQWKRDYGLTMRIWLTLFLLFIVYLVFLTVLSAFGVGLIWLLLFVVGWGFIQFYFCDKIVLWSTGSRVIEVDEYPEIHRMVERLCQEADLPKPRIAIMQSPVPNAFATGKGPKSAVVAVTDSILRTLSPKELEAVLAHELSHVKNRDVLTLTIASFIAMLASFVFQWGFFLTLGNRREGSLPFIVVWVVAIVVWVVSMLLISTLSRYREFAADRGSAYITKNPRALMSALVRISGRMDSLPPEIKEKVAGANAFYIIPALSGRSLMELFSTHPSLERRIAALEQVETEIKGY